MLKISNVEIHTFCDNLWKRLFLFVPDSALWTCRVLYIVRSWRLEKIPRNIGCLEAPKFLAINIIVYNVDDSVLRPKPPRLPYHPPIVHSPPVSRSHRAFHLWNRPALRTCTCHLVYPRLPPSWCTSQDKSYNRWLFGPYLQSSFAQS